MSAHTPGPWIVEHDPRWNFANVKQANGEKPDVAKGLYPGDAHLIAAAPDLLAALERAEYTLSAIAAIGVPETLEVARAAIGKAKGE